MKFLLDVCVSSRSLEDFLARQGHHVLSAISVDPHAAELTGAVLVTVTRGRIRIRR